MQLVILCLTAEVLVRLFPSFSNGLTFAELYTLILCSYYVMQSYMLRQLVSTSTLSFPVCRVVSRQATNETQYCGGDLPLRFPSIRPPVKLLHVITINLHRILPGSTQGIDARPRIQTPSVQRRPHWRYGLPSRSVVGGARRGRGRGELER